MEDIGHHGRTVLFVSHNLSAITRLCPRAILLDAGKVVRDGPSHEVVRFYLHSDLGTTAAREWRDPATAPGSDYVRLRSLRVLDDAGEVTDKVDIRKEFSVRIEYDVTRPGKTFVPNLHFVTVEGLTLFVSLDLDPEWRGRERPVGRWVSSAFVPGNLLGEGTVTIGVAISTMPNEVHFFEREAVAFEVIDAMTADTARGDYGGPLPGAFRPLLAWKSERLP
jgi:lipopolysaccharide transport system ATP-binding protein